MYIQEKSPMHENIFNPLLPNNNKGNSNDNQYPCKEQ